MNSTEAKKNITNCEFNNCGLFNSQPDGKILNLLCNDIQKDIQQVFISHISQEQMKIFVQVCRNWNNKVINIIACNQKNKIDNIIYSLKPFSLASCSSTEILNAKCLTHIEFVSKKIRNEILLKLDNGKIKLLKESTNKPFYFKTKKDIYSNHEEIVDVLSSSDQEKIKKTSKDLIKLNEFELCIEIANKQWDNLSKNQEELSDESNDDSTTSMYLISERAAKAIKACWIQNKNFDRLAELVSLIKNEDFRKDVISDLISNILDSEDINLLKFLLKLGKPFQFNENEVIDLLIKYNCFNEVISYLNSLKYSESEIINLLHDKGCFSLFTSDINSLKKENEFKVDKLIDLEENLRPLIEITKKELECLLTSATVIIDSLPDISYFNFDLNSIFLDLFSEGCKQKMEQLDLIIQSIEQYSTVLIYFPQSIKNILQLNNTLTTKGYSQTIGYKKSNLY